MKTLLDKHQQVRYTTAQLEAMFPIESGFKTADEIGRCVDAVFARLDFCFSRVNNKYYSENNVATFTPLNTDQYAAFLYLLSREAANTIECLPLADQLFALNKSLHGLDVYHGVSLPDVFLFVHSVGTVLGRAEYGNYLVIYQGVTVGGNIDLEYPTIMGGVALFAGSKVIGRSCVGEGAMMAADSLIMDADVPPHTIYDGRYPSAAYRPTRRTVFGRYFKSPDDQL